MKKFLFLFLILSAKFAAAQTTVKFDDARLHYQGRIQMTDTAAVIAWSGSSVKINFTGNYIKYTVLDEKADNYLIEILDGKIIGEAHEPVKKKFISMLGGLSNRNHTLEIFKRTEWTMGKVFVYGFETDGKVLPADPVKKRKIEFFGNSITCGYAVMDTEGKDRGTSPYENNYISYAAITARHFNAEYQCIARSGIGILVSWFPQVMPEMYDLLDPTDPKSKWDFKKYTPDVVVVNLFQNDSWLVNMKDHEQFKARFGTTAPSPETIIKAYADFIKTIRGKYPNAQIICALGSMDATKAGSVWPGYIEKAVAGLGDKKIYTHFFPYKDTNGHPSAAEQQAMADSLIGFIEAKVKW